MYKYKYRSVYKFDNGARKKNHLTDVELLETGNVGQHN